ncbi:MULTISPECIES: toxic anion resistance protein [unclassified Exiguobacterium]|uniref:toxic anion resistance protein n=1 Tax=unclassified Exiguobacterium TaxID=2644629 RepID=UPI000EDF1ADA|nr:MULTISPECIES: toxic anion resistance protein [unclassified Exiguobacterium]MDX1258713.1 toxic anion resistance protein [Exiguobacterium sp. K1]HCN57944.1 toxic anion resistance protein [Exiguobacterium sp.]
MTHSDNNSWQQWPEEESTTQPTISDPSVDLNLAEATSRPAAPVRPVEDMIPSDVPAEQRQKIERLLQVIDLNKSDAVMQYGAPVQRELSQFSDQVLSEVKMKDGGDAGKLLSDLMQRVRQMDPDTLQEKKSFWSNVPVIGRAKKKAETYFLQYEKMSAYLEEVVHNLDRSKFGLMKDITLLDQMYQKNKRYFEELNLYIAAGETKIAHVREHEIEPLRMEVERSQDQTRIQELNDMIQLADRFEKKIHDLKLSRTISLQMAPQIRVIQQNNQILAEKIESAVVNTIPLWKNQVVLSLSLSRQKTALQMQKDVTNTTNQLLEQNSRLLKDSSIEIAEENEKGIVSVESLKVAHQNLIETLDETLRIQQDGKQKRRDAEHELERMENELKQKVMEVASKNRELPNRPY